MVQSCLVRTDSNKIARSQSTLSVTYSRKPSFVFPRESLRGTLWLNAVLIDFPNDRDAMEFVYQLFSGSVAVVWSRYGSASSFYGPAQNSNGPAQNSNGPAQSSYGLAQSSYGPAQSSYGPAPSSYGLAQSSYGLAQSSYGLARSSFGLARRSIKPIGRRMEGIR